MLQAQDVRQVEHYDIDHPWHRQPCDDDREWALFCLYIRQPLPRTIGAVASRTGYNWTHHRIDEISIKNHWRNRATAWDNYLQAEYVRTARVTVLEKAKDQGDRFTLMLSMLHEIAETELKKLLKQVREGSFSALRPRDLLALVQSYHTMHQLITGGATERIELAAAEQWFNEHEFGYEELRAIKRIQEKLKVKAIKS